LEEIHKSLISYGVAHRKVAAIDRSFEEIGTGQVIMLSSAIKSASEMMICPNGWNHQNEMAKLSNGEVLLMPGIVLICGQFGFRIVLQSTAIAYKLTKLARHRLTL